MNKIMDEKTIELDLKENFFSKVSRLPQRQDSTYDQLKDLARVANHLGMYDAEDALNRILLGLK